jgi:hypothetical protein
VLAPLALILALLAVLGLGVPACHVISEVSARGFFKDLTFLDILLFEVVHIGVLAIELVLQFLDLLAIDWLRNLGLSLNERIRGWVNYI